MQVLAGGISLIVCSTARNEGGKYRRRRKLKKLKFREIIAQTTREHFFSSTNDFRSSASWTVFQLKLSINGTNYWFAKRIRCFRKNGKKRERERERETPLFQSIRNADNSLLLTLDDMHHLLLLLQNYCYWVNNIQENPLLNPPSTSKPLSFIVKRKKCCWNYREGEREKERERESVCSVWGWVCVWSRERERESLIVPGMLCWVNVNYSVFITWTHSLPKLAINPG